MRESHAARHPAIHPASQPAIPSLCVTCFTHGGRRSHPAQPSADAEESGAFRLGCSTVARSWRIVSSRLPASEPAAGSSNPSQSSLGSRSCRRWECAGLEAALACVACLRAAGQQQTDPPAHNRSSPLPPHPPHSRGRRSPSAPTLRRRVASRRAEAPSFSSCLSGMAAPSSVSRARTQSMSLVSAARAKGGWGVIA